MVFLATPSGASITLSPTQLEPPLGLAGWTERASCPAHGDGRVWAGIARNFDVTITNVAPSNDHARHGWHGRRPNRVVHRQAHRDRCKQRGLSPASSCIGMPRATAAPYKSGDGASFTFSLDDDGAYAVKLTATDKDNGQGTASFNFNVANQAPTISTLNAPATGVEGTLISFKPTISDPGPAERSGGAVGIVVGHQGRSRLHDLGSGATGFLTPGRQCQLRREHYRDRQRCGCPPLPRPATIAVTNVAPDLHIASTATVTQGATYALALHATDPGADTISSWAINWGDGSPPTNLPGPATSASHVYANGPASQTLSVVAADEAGQYTASQVVTVTGANALPTIAISGPNTVAEGATYTLACSSGADQQSRFSDCHRLRHRLGRRSIQHGHRLAIRDRHRDARLLLDGPAAQIITVTLLNGQTGYANPATLAVAITDVGLTVALTAPTSVPEGSSFALNLGPIVDPGADTVASYIVQWGDGTIDAEAGAPPATLTHTYANGDADLTIILMLTDEDGPHTAGSTPIHIANVAPTFDAGANASMSVGDALTRSGSFTDPGADTWTATVDCYGGDGGTARNRSRSPAKTSALNHVYSQTGTYTVTVNIADSDGGSQSDSFVVTVAAAVNTVPDFEAGADASLNQGDSFTRSGSFTGPDTNTWAATVDYGDGLGTQPLTLTGKAYTLSHVYNQTGVFTVTLTIADNAGGSKSDSFVVTVAAAGNAAPVFDAGAEASLDEGGTFTRAGSFTDPDSDAWTATVDYGDGLGAQPLALTGKTYTLSHLYPQQGSYTITVTIADNDGGTLSDSFVASVANVAAFDAGADAAINEDDNFTRLTTFTDPGADTWTASGRLRRPEPAHSLS